MNTPTPFIVRALLLTSLVLAMTGCVAEVGGGPVVHEGGWYHDGPWLDSPGWHGEARGAIAIDVHPPGRRR